MLTKNKCFLLCVLFSLFFSASGFAATNWEYLAKTFPLLGNDLALTQQFNKLGEQQWELVNCTESDAKIVCVFKRPIIEK